MAKVLTQTVTIHLSKLAKDSAGDAVSYLSDETIADLQLVIEQLVNDDAIVVEIQKD